MPHTEDPSPPRVGFVGCGNHAVQNIYPCLGPAGAELVAAADLWETRRELVRRTYHPENLYDDGNELLEKEGDRLDALFVVGPPDLHEQMLEQAISRRIPTYVEKPPCRSAGRARELAALAREHNVPVMVGFMKRFAAGYMRALQESSEPEFGGRQHLVVRYSHGAAMEAAQMFAMMSIHAIDLACAFMGQPAQVQVARQTAGNNTNFSLQIKYHDGGLATVILDSSLPGVMERLELAGTGHFITVDELVSYRHYISSGSIWQTPSMSGTSPNFALQTEENTNLRLQGYLGEVREFVAALREGRPFNGPNLDDAAIALEIGERTAQSKDGDIFKLEDLWTD